MLELVGYLFLAALFVAEISILRWLFTRQAKKELDTFIKGWDSTHFETVKQKEPKLVANKIVTHRTKD